MIRDFRLSGEVGGCVVVRRDKLGVLVFVELVGSGFQHTLLQVNAPFELHIPKCTERHEEAKQPVLLMMTEIAFSKCWLSSMLTKLADGAPVV